MGTTIDAAGWPRRGEEGPAVVALGGGHGLSATLRALRHVTHRLTAVVTVADDGGSSGRLRREFDCLPPGDLRMALASLCEDSEWGLTWRDVLQHRFEGQGELDNHALGNLLILALWQLLGDDVSGLDWVGRLLTIHGRVVPMSSSPLVIEADIVSGGSRRRVSGQVAVASASWGTIPTFSRRPRAAPRRCAPSMRPNGWSWGPAPGTPRYSRTSSCRPCAARW